ncbi:hypothetical protein ACFPM0_03315 [Pseudonocardia sulfidoxydans]|uniref:hypothetical protein n=1 Tax=Pseudonocardia sulfidoxydans TaxID=54011 RepID=UPI00361D2512
MSADGAGHVAGRHRRTHHRGDDRNRQVSMNSWLPVGRHSRTSGLPDGGARRPPDDPFIATAG